MRLRIVWIEFVKIMTLAESEGGGCRAATSPPVSVARAERVFYGIRNRVRLLRLTLALGGADAAARLPYQNEISSKNYYGKLAKLASRFCRHGR